MRLFDKEPTKWEDIPAPVQSQLGSKHNINDKSTWEARGDERCFICPPGRRSHPLSRCIRVWASTVKGQAFFGSAKAAEYLASLGANPVLSLQDVLLSCDCLADMDKLGMPEAEFAESLSFVCDACDIDLHGEDADGTGRGELLAFADECTSFW
jgi:hypothetical protein